MYGYKIINGKAIIDEQEAGVIVSIFNGYLSGLSMKAAAENIKGLDAPSCSNYSDKLS